MIWGYPYFRKHPYDFNAPRLGTSDPLLESYVDMFVLNTFKPTAGFNLFHRFHSFPTDPNIVLSRALFDPERLVKSAEHANTICSEPQRLKQTLSRLHTLLQEMAWNHKLSIGMLTEF